MIDMYPTKVEMNQAWVDVDGFLRYHLMPSRLIDSYIAFADGETCRCYTALDTKTSRVWHFYFKFDEDGSPRLIKSRPLLEKEEWMQEK